MFKSLAMMMLLAITSSNHVTDKINYGMHHPGIDDINPVDRNMFSDLYFDGYWGLEDRKTCDYIIDVYDGKTHINFGIMNYVEDSYAELNYADPFLTYKSGWVAWDEHWDYFPEHEFFAFTFDKFIDIPIESYYIRNVPANSFVNFTLTTKSAKQVSTTTIIHSASEYLLEFQTTVGSNIGGEVDLGFLKVSQDQYVENSISIAGSLYEEMTEIKQSTTSIETVLTETFSYQNTYNHPIYYQLGQRQKFRLGFIADVHVDYDEPDVISSGTFGLDKTYDYCGKDIHTLYDIHFFLIPEDDPYFDVSIYYDNADGVKTILEKSHPSILYF